jgi:hypothetical protein
LKSLEKEHGKIKTKIMETGEGSEKKERNGYKNDMKVKKESSKTLRDT